MRSSRSATVTTPSPPSRRRSRQASTRRMRSMHARRCSAVAASVGLGLLLGGCSRTVVVGEDFVTGGDSGAGMGWYELGSSATGGGISDTARRSSAPSLVIEAGGAPAIAWQEDEDGADEVRVRRWEEASGLWTA